ncbi:MAG: hypothetical protein ACJ71H_09655 [Nitrososphaeraceae archaeon]
MYIGREQQKIKEIKKVSEIRRSRTRILYPSLMSSTCYRLVPRLGIEEEKKEIESCDPSYNLFSLACAIISGGACCGCHISRRRHIALGPCTY